MALCRALDTSADYLLGLADTPFPPAGTPTEPLDLADLLASEKTIQFAGRPLDKDDREKARRILEALFGDNRSQDK